MKDAIFGTCLLVISGVAQANAPGISANLSPLVSSSANNQALGISVANLDPCSSFTAGLTGAPYGANMNLYAEVSSLDSWNNAPWSSGHSAAVNSWPPPQARDPSRGGGHGRPPRNGEHVRHFLSFAVLNGQGSHGAFTQPIEVNDSDANGLDSGDSVSHMNAGAAAVREPQAAQSQTEESRHPAQDPQSRAPQLQLIAMFLAGLGLLALGARRGRNDPFD